MTLSNIQEREFSFHYSVDYVANTLLHDSCVILYRERIKSEVEEIKTYGCHKFISYHKKYLSINIK